jgi:hypothetical protein
MLISANIGRVSWENRTRFINRNVFLECVHSEIIFFAVVVRTSKSRSIWYETLKLKSVKSTMRTGVWFRSYHRRYFLRKFDFIGRGGNSGREIHFLRLFVLQYSCIRSVPGISVRMLDILFIFSVSLKYSHWTRTTSSEVVHENVITDNFLVTVGDEPG